MEVKNLDIVEEFFLKEVDLDSLKFVVLLALSKK